MTDELAYQTGRMIGLIIALLLDIAVSYFVGAHFHSLLVGLTLYYVLGRLTTIQDATASIKRKLS